MFGPTYKDKYERSAADTPAPDFKAQLDHFSMQIAMAMQQMAKQLGRLEQRLDALAETAGLSWQQGWAPKPPVPESSGKNGKVKPTPWAFSGGEVPKLDGNTVGGGVYL